MARILIADDEPWYAEPLVDALSERGHDVDVKTSSQEAFEFLQSSEVDLVVIDLLMSVDSVSDLVAQLMAGSEPDPSPQRMVGGLDLLARVRQALPQLRVAILSVLRKAERDEVYAAARGLDLSGVPQLYKADTVPQIVQQIDDCLKDA